MDGCEGRQGAREENRRPSQPRSGSLPSLGELGPVPSVSHTNIFSSGPVVCSPQSLDFIQQPIKASLALCSERQ